MAPTKPGKRSSIRVRTTKPTTSFEQLGATFRATSPPNLLSDGPDPEAETDAFTTTGPQRTKKMKRDARSRGLLTRLESSGITNSAGVKKSRNRRGKASAAPDLVDTISSLADALPEIDTPEDVDGVIARTRAGNIADPNAPKRMESLGTHRGMRKKKEKLEARERERFGRNLAIMMGDETKFGIGARGVEGTLTKTDGIGSGAGAAGGLRALRQFVEGRLAVQKALG